MHEPLAGCRPARSWFGAHRGTRNRGGSHQGYPTSVANVLGLLGIAVFIVLVISLAAGVTWVVVQVSPSPAKKKAKAAKADAAAGSPT